jgi:predicted house-cleaning NTP pyrophosphatase (Maf/HAM1 superfamily)
MKTAMQKLKDWANQYKGQMISADQVVLQAHNLLEKEEEQLEVAFDLGRDEVTSAFIIDGEDYYNKKFNQNK